MTAVGYKLLRADGRSISSDYGEVQYDLDGSWTTAPGNGAYVARDLPGLLRGGYGPLLAEMEYADPTGRVDDGSVITARRVRVTRTATFADAWVWARVACRAARAVAHLSHDPVVLVAIEAAERCQRERTVEAAQEVAGAAEEAAEAAAEAAEAAEEAAAWAARAAAWAAWAARAAWAAEAAAAAAEAAAWAVAEAKTSHMILGYLIEEAWGAVETRQEIKR